MMKKSSDNYYLDCPARSIYNRDLTDYTHPKLRDYNIRKINELKNNDIYRIVITNNANTIMDNNRTHYLQLNSCNCDFYSKK